MIAVMKKTLKGMPIIGPVLLKIKRKMNGKAKAASPGLKILPDNSLIVTGPTRTVGVIGLGPQGRALCQAVLSLSNVQLVGVADLSEQILSELETKYFIKCGQKTKDFKDFQKIGSLDLICIATTTPSHRSIALEVIKLKLCKTLLIEKPFTSSISEAKEIIEAAKDAGITVYINHSRRWHQNYLSLKSLLKENNAGPIQGISVFFGKGGIANLGVHFLDLMAFLMEDDVAEVESELDATEGPDRRGAMDPGGRVWLKYTKGQYGFLDFSEGESFKGKKLIISCQNARIEFDERYGIVEFINESGRREFKALHGDLMGHLRAKPVIAGILNSNVSGSSAQDGMKSIELLLAIKHSASVGGQKVSFPLPDNIASQRLENVQ